MSDDSKCSIIHKYSEDEARRLLKEGELPENFKLNLDDFEEVNSDEDDAETITNRQYEERLQDRYRQIRILDAKYLSQFVAEFDRLIRG